MLRRPGVRVSSHLETVCGPCIHPLSLSLRYEVLQFCWLSPDQRPAAEDVHRLLTYLRMQSQRDSEVDFEQQWNALKPNASSRDAANAAAFPILDHFARDRLGREVDEVLTVTQTSRGLSFECVWEAAKHGHFAERDRGPPDEALSYASVFFPTQCHLGLCYSYFCSFYL